MVNNYFNSKFKNLIAFFLVLFFIGIFQNTKALTPSFESKFLIEKNQLKTLGIKNNNYNQQKSTKKTIFNSLNTKSNTKLKKISFRKKLSILKLVLKTTSSNKNEYRVKEKRKAAKWNGQHTTGLLSWASVLVAVMAFFTGHLLLGILASCSAILFLLLIFVEKDNEGTVDNVLWIFSQIINLIVIIGTIFD